MSHPVGAEGTDVQPVQTLDDESIGVVPGLLGSEDGDRPLRRDASSVSVAELDGLALSGSLSEDAGVAKDGATSGHVMLSFW